MLIIFETRPDLMSFFYTCILNAKYGVLQLMLFIAFSIQLVHPSGLLFLNN